MNRRLNMRYAHEHGVPRTRGDEPTEILSPDNLTERSPHTRG